MNKYLNQQVKNGDDMRELSFDACMYIERFGIGIVGTVVTRPIACKDAIHVTKQVKGIGGERDKVFTLNRYLKFSNN